MFCQTALIPGHQILLLLRSTEMRKVCLWPTGSRSVHLILMLNINVTLVKFRNETSVRFCSGKYVALRHLFKSSETEAGCSTLRGKFNYCVSLPDAKK